MYVAIVIAEGVKCTRDPLARKKQWREGGGRGILSTRPLTAHTLSPPTHRARGSTLSTHTTGVKVEGGDARVVGGARDGKWGRGGRRSK